MRYPGGAGSAFTKLEQGDPAVLLGIYAPELLSLGLVGRLASLADPAHRAEAVPLEAIEEASR